MASVSMTELRKETERILERVVAGETIDITRWGKPVATIRATEPGAMRLFAQMREVGDRWTWDLDSPNEREHS